VRIPVAVHHLLDEQACVRGAPHGALPRQSDGSTQF
jgi:hypothetical protein